MAKTKSASSARGSSSKSSSGRSSSSSKTSARSRSSGSGGGKAGGAAKTSRSAAAAQATVDHEQIRRWAEERGGKPSCVLGTGGRGDTGLLRIDFPGYSGKGKLQEITWDEFFEKFEDQKLALLYQDTTKDGQPSNFNKLISRGTASRGRSAGKSSTGKSSAGKSSSGRGGRSSSGGNASGGRRKKTAR